MCVSLASTTPELETTGIHYLLSPTSSTSTSISQYLVSYLKVHSLDVFIPRTIGLNINSLFSDFIAVSSQELGLIPRLYSLSTLNSPLFARPLRRHPNPLTCCVLANSDDFAQDI